MSKKCEECGEPISKIRIKVLPNTKYCVKCADKKPPEDTGVEHTLDLYDSSELNDIVSGED